MTNGEHTPSAPEALAGLDAMSNLTGKAYFKALTAHIAETCGADIAFAGYLAEGGNKLQTLALYWDGTVMDDEAFPVLGSPLRVSQGKDGCVYQSGVQALYPKNSHIAAERIESFIGLPLMDTDGKVIGLLCAESRTALEDTVLQDALGAFRGRAQVELRHYQTQEKLRETLSQALLLNYSKSMFMANISHELRNPLSAMIGYASLIRDRQVEGNQMQEYAAEICASGESLLTLINDIMSLAMLEISDENAQSERFDLTDLARTGNRMIQHQAAQKHLMVVAAKRTEPLYVKGDIGHTKKALMNLLTNAVKYTSLGRIEIEVARMDDGSARISVIDTGVGMTEEELEKACAPLTNFKNAYDMHQEGSGLGIPTSMVLMDRQGARLLVESERGKGTNAHLVFPPELVLEDSGDFI